MSTLEAGAANAIGTCLGVLPADRVVIVADDLSADVALALENAAKARAGDCLRVRLEDFGPRPMVSLPVALADHLRGFHPSVSLLALRPLEGEVPLRMALRSLLVGEMGCRHAHMPGITRQLMEQGMSADYNEIGRLARRLHGILSTAQAISVIGDDGTNLEAKFSPRRRWVIDGELMRHPGDSGNLPAGEVYTSPISVDGIMASRVLGDYFSSYGLLQRPVRFHLKDGLIDDLEVPAIGDLAVQLDRYLATDPQSKRVGEFAIGCNIALTGLSGNLLQDEKLPGVHIAFGNPYPDETGADWSCPTHLDVVATGCSIDVDGALIMRGGAFQFL